MNILPHKPYDYYNDADISILIGRKAVNIENHGDELLIHLSDGTAYKFFHRQDCCENVEIEEIIGDLDDLVDSPFMMAEEISNSEGPKLEHSSYTWTFYKFATAKGYVTIRWLGESNGYYSEDVDFQRLPNWTQTLPKSEIDNMLVMADSAEEIGDLAIASLFRKEAAAFTVKK